MEVHDRRRPTEMSYFPEKDRAWEITGGREAKLSPIRIEEAINFAEQNETSWPKDIHIDGSIPMLTDIEKPPYNRLLGPIKPRGGPNGLILKSGRIVAQWGDPRRPDMTFSIAKSYLAALTGIAIGDGLIKDIDEPVKRQITNDLFTSSQNKEITWRHLLQQTSEWEGTLFDRPDLVDRNRQIGPNANNNRKGQDRILQAPGTYWEYNDVRVNVLSLCLLYLFKKPLPEVLKIRIMDPIGASDSWSWFGYNNSFVEVDGKILQSVPGGTHWGGGIYINSFDHARFGLLISCSGIWDGHPILPQGWVKDLRTPCDIQPGYGYLWWLNTNKREWPKAADGSYAAVGAGSNILWIDPENNVVVVARWISQSAVAEFIGLVSKAFN